MKWVVMCAFGLVNGFLIHALPDVWAVMVSSALLGLAFAIGGTSFK